MQKRFDPKKLTLTTFDPAAYRKATGKLTPPKLPASPATGQPSSAPVPAGRTLLQLGRGKPSAQPVQAPARHAAPPPEAKQPAASEASPPSLHEPTDSADIPSPPPPPATPADSQEEPEQQPILSDSLPAPEPRSERAAGLHVQAKRQPRRSQKDADPASSVPFNTRQPKWLKDMFYKTCRDNGQTPSLVLRNLLKSYLNVCFLLFLVHNIPAAPAADTAKFSTDQLLSYFNGKALGLKSVLPDLKASAAVRHAFWQTGGQDSTDYVYADHSNTRIEAKLEIPILDISYLRDRSKDKDELRAHVMKSLSRILAAQKSVDVLQVRLSTLRTRLDYLRNQVNLKLVNKSDLFPVEDQFYTSQSALFEAQSTLEQRIIDLAVIAGNDWPEAYHMIVRWDGQLFNQERARD